MSENFNSEAIAAVEADLVVGLCHCTDEYPMATEGHRPYLQCPAD